MTKDELLALCAAYPGAAVDCPFEDGGNVVVRHAAGRKWFALVFERDGKLCVNLKCAVFVLENKATKAQSLA